jgi:hypothetical protein
MEQSRGTIYLRDNAWYKTENVIKMGISSTVKNRNTTYITGEIERGEYILIVEIPLDKMKILDKCLKMYFKPYHVYKGGGTEFYNRCIIDLIEPYLQQINMEYKILSKEEINVTNRFERVSNIPNMTKVKQVFNQLNVQNMIQKYKTKKTTSNPLFYCNDCCCGFQRKSNYDYHLTTIKHKNRVSKQKTPSFVCSFCNKSFSHCSSLSRHKTNCEENQIKEAEKDTPTVDLEAKIKELRERVEEIKKSREEEILRSQNKVSVNCFGNENLDYIADNDILDCMNNINVSIPVLLEKIHFDPEHPENNNVRIPNKKLPHAEIMNNKSKWELISKKDTIHSMVETAYNILCKTFREKQHELTVNMQQNFRDFQEIYRHRRTIRDIKTKVELLILGNTRK